MLKNFRKPKQEEKIEEEVVFEKVEENPFVVSAEQQRLNEAQAELARVIAKDGSLDEELHSEEVAEAERQLNFFQKKMEQAKKDKEARFHAANKIVLEAQADIALAKQQKEQYERVSTALKNFKSTDAGKDIPDDIAVILALLFERPDVTAAVTYYYAYKRRMGLK